MRRRSASIFSAELERGSVEATAKVAQSLFQMATQGKSVAAAIFWMKARAGWREKHEVIVRDDDDISNMTHEDLERELSRLQASRAAARPLSIDVEVVADTED